MYQYILYDPTTPNCSHEISVEALRRDLLYYNNEIKIYSDIHLEFGSCALTPSDADVVVLAGDIGCRLHGVRWAREQFSEVPVIYVCGNHEYYGEKYPRQIEKLSEEAQGSNVSVVENEFISIGEYKTRYASGHCTADPSG